MQKVIIIGGGFGGLSAARILAKAKKDVAVTLIDQRDSCDFLPMLPDVFGRAIPVSCLRYNLHDASCRFKFSFFRGRVDSVDLAKREVLVSGNTLGYDYLIIASGSETNFYHNDNIKEYAFRLDDTNDAARISSAMEINLFDNYAVAGGGYTGIEVATNLAVFLRSRKRKGKIVIIERAAGILGMLPQWMKDYTAANLKQLGIEVIVDAAVSRIEEGRVLLSTGAALENSILIWCVGVKTGDFLQRLGREMNNQGRVKVDKYLRLDERCFVIGDTAQFSDGNTSLRMAVQFSMGQGKCAARNILRLIYAQLLREYKPADLGFIIPMANNQSCGIVLGMKVKGLPATLLHYIMCIYRVYGFKHKWMICRSLLKGGAG